MANTTIMNGVAVNTVTAGMSVTGPCVVQLFGLLHNETVSIEIAPTDTEAQYEVEEQRSGPNAKAVRLEHPGTYFVRLRLYGVLAGRAGTCSGVVSQ